MSRAMGEDTPLAVLVQLSKADSCTAGRGFLQPGSYLRSCRLCPGQLLASHCPRRGCGSPEQLTCLSLRRGLEQGGMVRRKQAGTMGTSVFPCLFVIILTRCSPSGCAGGSDSASHGK